jgi:hypothetical protein
MLIDLLIASKTIDEKTAKIFQESTETSKDGVEWTEEE